MLSIYRTRGHPPWVTNMTTKAVHLLVVPGFADWEPAHALAELRRHGGCRVEAVGLSDDAVESMGGLRVQPTRALPDVDQSDVAVFIVPGGERLESTLERELEHLLRQLDGAGVPIAAICGATLAVARAGLLKGRRHTSNGLAYLQQHVASYADEASYVDAPAVRDRGLITASGLADVEFASEIMAELGDAAAQCGAPIGSLSVLCRAGRDRDPESSGRWRARHRRSASESPVNCFARTASQCGDSERWSGVSGVDRAVAQRPTGQAPEDRQAGRE